jgi:hypothetical protein
VVPAKPKIESLPTAGTRDFVPENKNWKKMKNTEKSKTGKKLKNTEK